MNKTEPSETILFTKRINSYYQYVKSRTILRKLSDSRKINPDGFIMAFETSGLL